MEPSRTVPAVPDEDDALPARPAYAWVLELEKRFADLSAFERDVLQRRLLVDNPTTLQEIATDNRLTRERIRQIEARALGRLAGDPHRKSGRPRRALPSTEARTPTTEADVVQKALDQLSQVEPPVTEAGLVEAGFEPLDSMATRLLLALANRAHTFRNGKPVVVEHAGRRWLVVGDRTPRKLVVELTEAARGTGVVSDLVELWVGIETALRPHVGPEEEAADLAAGVVDGLGLEEIGGQYAVLGGGIGVVDRLSRILRANGAPMDRKVLLSYFPDRSERTVLNALLEPPFVRVGRDDFALEEWGATPRPQLRELLYDQLDRHGQVAVSYLADLAAKYEYSRNSITFYSSLPDVIEEAGVLRRRCADDPPAVPEPGLDDKCFRVVAGPHRGCWSSVVRVSHRRLYHGPQSIPTPLAELLELEPGAMRVPVAVNASTVQASWGQSPYLFGGELRPVLDALGFADGELIRLVVTGPGVLVAERVHVAPRPDTPFRTLVAGACLYDEVGTPVPDAEIAEALAYAIGLDADTPLPIVERRLATRNSPALREALGLIFPEVCAR